MRASATPISASPSNSRRGLRLRSISPAGSRAIRSGGALTNIVKHARARKVSIILVRREGKVTALVEDDGEGFDPDAVRADGLGLLGMRERVGLVDGRLTLESSPGAGTTLAVEVPLP